MGPMILDGKPQDLSIPYPYAPCAGVASLGAGPIQGPSSGLVPADSFPSPEAP